MGVGLGWWGKVVGAILIASYVNLDQRLVRSYMYHMAMVGEGGMQGCWRHPDGIIPAS